MQEIRPFPLTKHFVVTSFATTLLVAIATSILTGKFVEDEVLQRSLDYAEKFTRHLQVDILADFIQPTLDEVGSIDLTEPEQLDRLDRVVTRAIDDFRVHALYIFTTDGTVVYATNRDHIGGRTPPTNDLFHRAIQGEVVAAVRDRGDPLDLGRRGETSLLEIYIPVGSIANKEEIHDPSQVTNVIETYLELDVVNEEIRHTQVRVTTFTLLGGGILFSVLLLIVRRADLLIQQRSRDVVESNERLRKLTESLEEEVERRTEDLVSKEKLASLGTLAAGIAHEVNNPLATIAGAAEGLHRRVDEVREGGELDFSDFDHYLELIQLEAFRVKQLTQSLLNLSRQRSDEVPLRIDAGRLVHDMRDLVRLSGDMENVSVEIERGAVGLGFAGYETSIRQVIFNVMRNSVDAIHERLESDPEFRGGAIRWSVTRVGESIEFVCEDDGAGFAPEISRKLKEPFFTTKPPGKGTGLGLALCDSLLERMRGSMTIHSPGVGLGATVRFNVPDKQ